jgi:hypothetical protein
MNCKLCGKPVKLIPSAKERAKKYGGKPADYTKLFEAHTECTLKERQEGADRLLKESK